MESLLELKLQIDVDIVLKCVKKSLKNEEIALLYWQVNPLSTRTRNFTTAGVYRVHGTAKAKDNDYPWSLIVKIIEPEAEEKNNPKHFNYWKREALVFESGFLSELPNAIQPPECYMVEEKSETEVWLWMEEIKESNSGMLSLEEFSFIAKQIGLFQGCYAIGEYPLLQEEWICHDWLASWIEGCDKYSASPSNLYPKIKEYNPTIDTIMKHYLTLRKNEKKYLQQLSHLPRVMSHQDLSQQNMFISKNTSKLILIDWQYLSISGIGEDIGKLFGIAMSQGDIPIQKAWEYQEKLFDSYLEGLGQAGWKGNPLLARYGFCLSVAYRAAWEVPKLIQMLAQPSTNELVDQIEKYTQIVLLQLKLAEEAAEIF